MEHHKRESRSYRHRQCGDETLLDGMDLTYVSHIFYHPGRTYCASCDDVFPVHEFEWADTGECLTNWYSRYAAKFQGLDRFLGDELLVYLTIAIGTIVGGLVGFWVGNKWALGVAIGGSVVGVLLVGFIGFVVGAAIKEGVCRRVLVTEDFTSLE
ncbi:MAG: hypothetical protein KatS3mg110_3483 [Pirellulaceae bacterium]|nr:MAG: hypothetical protein KatS3mg110_3483 [Pirellulaceae bacterium]